MPLPSLTILRAWAITCVAILQGLGVFLAGIIASIRLLTSTKAFGYKRAQVESEVSVNESEAVLRLAKAHSLEFHDQLSAIEIVQKMMRESLVVEQRLIEKNETIEQQQRIIEHQEDQIKLYSQQLGIKSGEEMIRKNS